MKLLLDTHIEDKGTVLLTGKEWEFGHRNSIRQRWEDGLPQAVCSQNAVSFWKHTDFTVRVEAHRFCFDHMKLVDKRKGGGSFVSSLCEKAGERTVPVAFKAACPESVNSSSFRGNTRPAAGCS